MECTFTKNPVRFERAYEFDITHASYPRRKTLKLSCLMRIVRERACSDRRATSRLERDVTSRSTTVSAREQA